MRGYGSKSLADVFAPAIALARDGFPLVEYNVSAINDTNEEFKGRHAFYEDGARNYTDWRALQRWATSCASLIWHGPTKRLLPKARAICMAAR